MCDQTAENDYTRWACNACPWVHTAHPVYGWSERDDRAVEVHQTMLCPDAVIADGHACIGDDCPGCAAALARVFPPAKASVCEREYGGRHYFSIDGSCQRCGVGSSFASEGGA